MTAPRTGSATVRAMVAGVVLLVVAAVPVEGQQLTGRVLDSGSDQPLADVALTLLHPDGQPVGDPVPSDAGGRFAIEVPEPGSYYLRADLIGYTSIVDGIFHFEAPAGRMDVSVFLRVEPVEVEGIDVRVARAFVRRRLVPTGFYDRAASGAGDFVTPEDIESRFAADVSDYLRMIPGVIQQSGRVLFKSLNPGGQTYCEPWVWVDGIRLVNGSATIGGPAPGDGLDDRVHAEDVIAIEVYRRRSSVPFQYYVNLPDAPFCGAIVIWTRRGR